MKPSPELFQLIQTLSKEERRGFHLHAKQYGGEDKARKYFKLFQAIAKQPEYDEGQLKRKMAGIISPQSFASWKRHLMGMLEQFLREFHAGKSNSSRLMELLCEAELLHQRSIFERSHKKLEDAQVIASRYEDLISLMRINEAERRFVKEFHGKQMRQKVDELLAQYAAYSAKLSLEHSYTALYDKLSITSRTQLDPRSDEVRAQIQQFQASELLQDGASMPTFKARRMYHHCRAICFHFLGNDEAEFQEYQDMILDWKAHPHFIDAEPKIYKIVVANFLHSATKLHRYQVMHDTLEEVRKIKPSNEDEAAEDFQSLDFFRLVFWANTGRTAEAVRMIPEIESGLKRYAWKVNDARKRSFRMNLVLACFFHGEPKMALYHLNEFFALPKTEHRTDVFSFARMLEPVLHYEAKEIDLAAHKCHALDEWLRSHQRLLSFERSLLRHLGVLFKSVAEAGVRDAFRSFAEELKTFSKPFPTGFQAISVWAEARAEGISCSEQFQKQYRKQAAELAAAKLLLNSQKSN